MPIRKTNEQFKKEISELVNDEYIFLDEYVNYMTHIKVKHNMCQHIYMVTPSSFIQGSRCPKCSYSALKTNDKFKKEIENLTRGEYKVLSEYKKSKEDIELIHVKCGHKYKVKPNNFLSGQRCPNCRYKNLSKKVMKEQRRFEEDVFALVGNEYIFMENYNGNKKKLKIKHDKCGFIYKVSPDNFLRGNRCPDCAWNTRRTPEKFEAEVKKITGTEYSVVKPYKENGNKIAIKHKNCEHEYFVDRHEFIRGTRCPRCRESKGERVISNYLDFNDYLYKRERVFLDLIADGYLRFDFALLNNDESVYALIEYDGEQHFKPVGIWGGTEGLIKRQYNDNLKNEYCEVNNIPLLRIPYTDFELIGEILDEFLLEGGEALWQA